MRHPVFTLYGLALLLAGSWASMTGWTPFRSGPHLVSPKSVRDNPGAYRPIYSGYRRYSGGK